MSQSSVTLHNILGKQFVGSRNDMCDTKYILFDAPPFDRLRFIFSPSRPSQTYISLLLPCVILSLTLLA